MEGAVDYSGKLEEFMTACLKSFFSKASHEYLGMFENQHMAVRYDSLLIVFKQPDIGNRGQKELSDYLRARRWEGSTTPLEWKIKGEPTYRCIDVLNIPKNKKRMHECLRTLGAILFDYKEKMRQIPRGIPRSFSYR